MRHLPAIDGLRAVAVLAVVAYHAGLPVPAGFAGVDVFFVISGYLITRLLLADGDLLTFYARRVRRIFPAAAVVVLAVLAASPFLLDPTQQAHTALSAGAALVFVANVFFQFTSGGYFDASAESMPLLHLWSLSVEEQFYFVWPALIALVPRRWLRPTMIGLALASFALANWLDPQAAFYQMPARAWELAAGGIVATLPMRALPRWTAPVGVLAILLGCLAGYSSAVGVLPAVAGAVLVIAAVHGGASVRVLELRPVVGIGLISYSLYLWHWPLLAFYRATTIGEGSLAVRLALCALAFVLAALSWRFVEQPFRRMTWPKGRTVGYGAAVSVVLAVSACAMGLRPLPVAIAPPDHPLAAKAERDRPTKECFSSSTDPAMPKCLPAAGARVVLWGDSMAYAWSPMVRGTLISRGACGPFLGFTGANPSRDNIACRDFTAIAAERVKGVDTLVLAVKWNSDGPAKLAPTLAEVAPHVRRIVILGPTPEMRHFVPKCIRRRAEAACAITRATFDARALPILAELRALAADYPNIEVVDVSDRFCTATTCPPVLDGVPLYWDAYHITATVARSYGGVAL